MKDNTKGRNVAASAALVTAMMLCFKLIGFLKQAVIAYYFGANAATDSYFIAYGFVMGISEAIVKSVSVSIVSVYSFCLVNKGRAAANRLVSGILEAILPLSLLIVGLLCIFAPILSRMIAPAYGPEESRLLQKYLYALAPMMIFCMLELIFGAILDASKSFFVPRLQSLIYSIIVILSCIFLSHWLEVRALIAAQYISSVIFSAMLIFTVKKYCRFSLVPLSQVPELRQIVLTALPLFLGNGVLQINQIVDKAITASLGAGAASALTYCHTLEQFVTNIMVVNIGNILFAHFAENVAKKELDTVASTLKQAINSILCVLIPISVITIVCAKDIVSIVYYRGSFTYDAVKLTAAALLGYALSFPVVGVRDLTIKSLYAFGDTKRPMLASIVSIICNIGLSILLARYIGILGISVATSISAVVGMLVNVRSFRRHLPEYSYKPHILTALKALPAALALLGVALLIQKFVPLSSLPRFLLICFAGMAVYFVLLRFAGIPELDRAVEMLRHRLKRKN